MGTRELGRLASRVKNRRLELYPSRLAAAGAVGISKDTWRRVEQGMDVRESTYVKIDQALGWAPGSCVAVADGGEPVLGHARLSSETVREATFAAARRTMPNVAIGDLDAFSEELVEVLRKGGYLSE
ncbi:helix-turn-helix transcriptional regulator [Streptomyces sp. NPDC088124]|uniref:helix-turn-helix domain-containing protein n=1 Tax=Streptomyces sp. NPDC088124 TaxID=3154654 RepID=UPI0034159D20